MNTVSRALTLAAVLLATAICILSAPGIALAGNADINLTWDAVYGFSYYPAADVTVTVTGTDGAAKGTATVQANNNGDFSVAPSDLVPSGVDIVSGDTIVITDGSETDTVTAILSAYTSATFDTISIESRKKQALVIVLDANRDGQDEYQSAETAANGSLVFSTGYDVLPGDYVSVYYEDGGNYVTVTPLAPYAVADITTNSVLGFHYRPDSTATVEVFSGLTRLGTAEVATDADGHFFAGASSHNVDIKSGHRVSISVGDERNECTTDLDARFDFGSHTVSGRTHAGSWVVGHIERPNNGGSTDATTTASSTGWYSMSAAAGLDDRIWVTSWHPGGNATQLEIVFGTTSRPITSPMLYVGQTNSKGGNVVIKETRPRSLRSASNSNQVTLRILTPGVTFAAPPRANGGSGIKLAGAAAALSSDNTSATWSVSQSTTSTAGSITVEDVGYSIAQGTPLGPIEVEVNGSAGVTVETVSNARIGEQPPSASLTVRVTDPDGKGIEGARVKVLKGSSVIRSAHTNSWGECGAFTLEKGVYAISVARIGYIASVATVNLTEDTTTAFSLDKSDIGVFVPEGMGIETYERIDSLLKDLGFKYSVVCEEDLNTPGNLALHLTSLFINSSSASALLSDAQVAEIGAFVAGGGSLYASDMSSSLVNRAFPGRISFGSAMIKPLPVTVDITDAGFADYINPQAPPSTLELDFGLQLLNLVAVNAAPTADTIVSGDVVLSNGSTASDMPLAVAFEHGSGRVVYTSYYLCSGAGAPGSNGRTLLDYLVLSTLVGGKINHIKSDLQSKGYTLEKINVGSMSDGDPAAPFGLQVAEKKDIRAVLGWHKGTLRLNLKSDVDDSAAYNTSNTSPVSADVLDATAGAWSYWATVLDQGSGYPYAIGVGTRAAASPRVTETNPVHGATDVPTNTSIRVSFSEEVKASLGFGGITLKNAGGKAVGITASLNDDNDVLTLIPEEELAPGTVYTVSIPRDAVCDRGENSLTAAYSFSFTTKASTGGGGTSGGGSSGGGSSGGNSGGGGSSGGAMASSQAPEKPTNIKAQAGKGGITLTWSAPTGQPVAGYNVYRMTAAAGSGKKLNAAPVTATTYTDTFVEPNTTYYYCVTAVGTNNKESAISAVVSASLVIARPSISFSDVSTGAWYQEYVTKLVQANVISGYADGTFRPNNSITRAEFAKIILSALEESPTAGSTSFADCTGHWAAGHIEAAKALGFISGYPDGTFKPNGVITRAEIAKIIASARGYALSSEAPFSDCTGHWASRYIAAVKNEGIVGGYGDGTFKPQGPATRAEVAKMVCKMLGL